MERVSYRRRAPPSSRGHHRPDPGARRAMRAFHLFICFALITMLVWISYSGVADATYGGLSSVAWISLTSLLLIVGIVFVFNESVRAYVFFRRGDSKDTRIER